MNKDKDILTAQRYAESLIEFGRDGKLSYLSISSDLATVLSILSHSPDLYDALVNPLVSVNSKEQIIEEVFSKDVDVLVKNFLKILVQKNRFNLIESIVEVFDSLLDEINEIARIEVISAVELNDSEKSRIQDKLSQKINKQICVKYNVDNAIIAGLVVKMGDDIIDMSLAQKLDNYKKAIIK